MSLIALFLARALAILAAGFAFGVLLKLSDLLQEHGYRWFPGAAMATGAAAAAFGLGVLWLGHAPVHMLWLAVLISWILRGRVDGPNHGLMAALMLLYLMVWGPRVAHYRWELAYFLVVLIPLGGAHDLLQYTKLPAPAAVRWFFEKQHLYWYLMAIGYCALFELDAIVVLSTYGFVKGYGALYDEARRTKLRSIGIRKDSART